MQNIYGCEPYKYHFDLVDRLLKRNAERRQEDESGWRQESLGTYCWPRRCEPVTTVLRPQPPFSLFGLKGHKEVIWQVIFCPSDVPLKSEQHVTNRSPVKFICNFIYANTSCPHAIYVNCTGTWIHSCTYTHPLTYKRT